MSILIFTDGSSRGNPGPGGWGAVVVKDAEVIEVGGREEHTTNNRMELKAAVEGLKVVDDEEPITVYLDSSYVLNGITKWIKGWKANGWITKAKEDVLNKDLWMELDEASSWKNVSWKNIGGHIGIAGNERCDEIATAFAEGVSIELYKGPLSSYSVKNILDISYDEKKLALKKSSSSRSNAPAYSYVSSVGGKVQVHNSWADCEKRVKGTKGARFKKALNKTDEEMLVKEFGGRRS